MSQSRQLAAIMFTDIVGYTALMGEDEQKAFELLKKNRSVQRPIIEKFNGRWLKEIGDGVLASFPTVSDAVYCAATIQKTCENEPDLKLRIGIHLGEVIFESNDVFGDGVNIASRLEPLAPIGGILVSESVSRNIENKKGIKIEFLREEMLKNVKHPVKIYQIEVEGVEVADTIPKTSSNRKFLNQIKIGLTAIGGLVFLGLAYIFYDNSSNTKGIAGTESEIDDKSIAVLPFVNMSNDPDQEALCDGLTEEIIHHLSRIKSFDKVISRSSAMSFKNSDKTLPEIAGLLKVNIVLEGSFQKSGDQIKITTQLIDAINDNHLWSEIYERPFGDIFDIQSEIAKNIAAKFKAEITLEEEIRLDKKPTESSEAYILLKKGWYKFGPGDDDKGAIDLMKKALEIDPGYAEAYARLAYLFLFFDVGFQGDKSISLEDPMPLVQKALDLDPELGHAYMTLGAIHFWKEWDFLKAEKAYKSAVELDPKNSFSYILYSGFLIKMGRAVEAIPYRERAFALDPTSTYALGSLAEAYFYSRKKEKTTETLMEFESLFPNQYSQSGSVGQMYLYLDNLEKAIDILELRLERSVIPRYISCLAIAYAKNGQNQKALDLLDQLKQMSQEKVGGSPEYFTALFYGGTGQKEEALLWLEKAYNSHDTELTWLKVDPMFKPIHDDPRYQDLLKRVGFQE